MHTRRLLIPLLAAILSLADIQGIQARDFYVSPQGKDTSAGTRRRPWRTPQAALSQVISYMRQHPGQAVRLIMMQGSYDIQDSLSIDGSGLSAPLTIMAHRGDSVVLQGGRRIRQWTPVSSPTLLAMWPVNCRGRVYEADLRALGIDDLGQPIGERNRVDLYLDGRRQTLARWPNQGFTRIVRAKGSTPVRTDGTKEGILEYGHGRIDWWAQEQEPCAAGYWYFDWYDDYERIAELNRPARTFRMAEPGSPYGYRNGARYYGLNLLCELDSVGEYYIDRRAGRIYWLMPEGTDPQQREAVLSLCRGGYMIGVSNMQDLTVRGLTLCNGRGGGISLRGSSGCRIEDCTLSQLAQTAIEVRGGNRNVIERCRLRELGHGGIALYAGDRRTLQPAQDTVRNCVVEDFSLYRRTYQPAVFLEGTGFLISHNRFQGSSSSAMRLDAGEVLVEYNQIFDVVRESDDQGGLDMWFDFSRRGVVIRYNHWRDILGSTSCGAAGVRFDDLISGQYVYGNVFEHCGSHAFGGVQIHGGKDNRVHDNLFYRCGSVVSFSPWWPEYWHQQFNRPDHAKRVFHDVDIRSELYLSRYPELKEPYEANMNRNYIYNNLAVQTPRLWGGNENGQNDLHDNTLLPPGEAEQPLAYYLQPDVLRRYGLQPIPFDEIGPR